MAKILSVEEAIASITAKTNKKGNKVVNRFNKKNFNTLMLAMVNDVDFTTRVAKKAGDSYELEDILVTKEFRKWCRNLVEKAGVDKSESEIVMSNEFKIDNVEGLYEFFATALYLYIEKGNRFDLLPKEDFKGSIKIKEVKKSSKVSSARSPQTKEYLGDFEVTKESHKVLSVKSSCPDWLKSRRKVN